MNHYIKTTSEFGRGLYAIDLGIKKNNIIAECELLVLDPLDTVLVNQTALKYYTFKYEGTSDCLVLGMGEIFNHSETPNVGYKLETIEDRKIMVFYALRDIEAHEQLFIDYNADTKVNAQNYKNAPSLY